MVAKLHDLIGTAIERFDLRAEANEPLPSNILGDDTGDYALVLALAIEDGEGFDILNAEPSRAWLVGRYDPMSGSYAICEADQPSGRWLTR